MGIIKNRKQKKTKTSTNHLKIINKASDNHQHITHNTTIHKMFTEDHQRITKQNKNANGSQKPLKTT